MNRRYLHRLLTVAILHFGVLAAHAETLKLRDAETRALDHSLGLQAAKADLQEAREQTDAQGALLWPRLSFDARYGYTDVVPSVLLPAPYPNIPFGARNSYSIGPTLSYTLWDQGAARKQKKSLSLLADARSSALAEARLDTLNDVRGAYAKLQLTLQEMQLTQESEQLSETQHKDIRSRLGAGAASRLDFVLGESDLLDFHLRHSQAEANARAAMIDLFATMNDLEHVPKSLADLKIDTIEETVKRFDDAKLTQDRNALSANPQLQAQAHTAESAEAAVESQRAAYFPQVQLQARASLDYPDGPDLSQIQQKTVGVTLSMPLVDWGQTGSLVEGKKQAAAAAHFRQKQMEVQLARDWAKAVDQVNSLREQRKVAIEAVTESQRSANLTYKTYHAGHVSITDVQNSNLRWLHSRVQLARVDAQLLTELLRLNALSGRDVTP